MSEVFGDDFPDVFSTVLNDAETAARRQVERAAGRLVATLRNRTLAEHERALRAEREVARLDAHLQTCEAARTNAELRLAQLQEAVTEPAVVFRHLGPLGGIPLCTAEHAASDDPPVCAACHYVQTAEVEKRANAIAREARGDRIARERAEQARDQLAQAVRVAVREAVPE